MTNQYGRRGATAGGDRQPSGGALSNPIRRSVNAPGAAGLGKLLAGRHQLEVLAVTNRASHYSVILTDPADHCHTEDVQWVPDWLRPGLKVRVTLGYRPGGYVLVRDGGRYQAADPCGGLPLTDWRHTAAEVWAQCQALHLTPAMPVLLGVSHGSSDWVPILHGAAPGQPAAPASADASGAGTGSERSAGGSADPGGVRPGHRTDTP